jgi:oligopeptide/dipeptide ABC transporter ATP-binding protein
MHAGQIMEIAPVAELFARPRHPYTERLLSSILRVDRPSGLDIEHALAPVQIRYDQPGCRFAGQCTYARDVCRGEFPPAAFISPGHEVFCYRHVAGAFEDR